MKKSRTILLSRLIIILFAIVLFYVIVTINKPPASYYDNYQKNIKGIVTNIKQTKYGYILEVKSKEKILVYCERFEGRLGNKINAVGKLETPSKNTVFNLFNYGNYLKSKKIYWIINDASIEILDDKEGIYFFKNKIIDYIANYKSYKYLNALILGNDDYIEEEVYNSYQINGISHLIAISGMQITLIAFILMFLLNLFFKNKLYIFFIIAFFLLFYTFLTGFSPSVIRAVCLFVALTVTKIINFNIKSIFLLLLIASIYLIYNPFIIMNIGFLFSFIISFYLILYSNYINNFKGYFVKNFIISLMAFLLSIPILIYNFHYINLLSPLINLFFIPIITIIIYPLSLVLLFFPILDNIFNTLCFYMESFSVQFSKIEMFIITLKHISIWGLLLYYIVIIYVVYKLINKKYIYLVFLLMILVFHSNINILKKETFLTTIDVGQGDCLLLHLKDNKNILIDTGGKMSIDKSGSKLAKKIIIPYLKSEGTKKIHYLIITHGDYDHMGEAINLVENFKVEKVIFNCGEFNELEQELIKVLDKKEIPYYSCIKELNIDNNKLYFLSNRNYGNENDNSSVIYTELNTHKFLFMGDAGVEVEEDLIEKYDLQNIDVLKAGHHGSKTSSSKEFINEINPKYSVISVGKNNRYGHPNKEVLENLDDSKIYRTDVDGSIMFKIKNNKLQIETCPP